RGIGGAANAGDACSPHRRLSPVRITQKRECGSARMLDTHRASRTREIDACQNGDRCFDTIGIEYQRDVARIPLTYLRARPKFPGVGRTNAEAPHAARVSPVSASPPLTTRFRRDRKPVSSTRNTIS